MIPRTIDAGVAAVEICRRHNAPLLSRGGGTSLAGECTNAAVVIDWSKYCRRLVSFDAERSTCIVEPGIVLDHLNDQLREHELEFGPRPATHSHCTIGGMIGNNSCGATAQRTGKVVDNIVRLEVLLYDGTRMWVGATSDEEYEQIVRVGDRRAEVYTALRELRDEYAEEISARFPAIPRRVSGYNLDSLSPEKNFHVAQALVGSEGTLVTVLRAELKLVPRVQAHSLVLLGYRDIATAADAVPAVVRTGPIALEALDEKLVGFQREKHLNPHALDLLPDGGAWLVVQMGGESQAEADRGADELLAAIGRDRDDATVAFFDDATHEQELWEVRESRARRHRARPGRRSHLAGMGGLCGRPGSPRRLSTRPALAVRRVRILAGLAVRPLRPGLRALSHPVRPLHRGRHQPVPRRSSSGRPIWSRRTADRSRASTATARRAASCWPGCSGPRSCGPSGATKAIFDPDDRMNPGKVVEPYALDENLRIGTDYRPPRREHLLLVPGRRRQLLEGRAPLRRRRQMPT